MSFFQFNFLSNLRHNKETKEVRSPPKKSSNSFIFCVLSSSLFDHGIVGSDPTKPVSILFLYFLLSQSIYRPICQVFCFSHTTCTRCTHTHRKVFTGFATVGVGINAVFFSDYEIQGYENQPHVFTNIQKDAREWIDRTIFQIDTTSTNNKSTNTPKNSNSSSNNNNPNNSP